MAKGKSEVKVKPLADRILARRIGPKEVKVGNLYVPDTAKEKPQEAEVIAVGPGKTDEKGQHMPMEVSVGQKILIGKYSGTDIKLDGKDHLILREDEVLAILN